MSSKTYIGNIPLSESTNEIHLEPVSIGQESFYKISGYDQMRPFFMSLVSDTDLWMFISTTGGLTAGRKDSDFALFPYYTDDKLEEASETTGSKTILRIADGEVEKLWEPFSDRFDGVYSIERNLYKNFYGNKLIFEEVNHDLGLTFRYSWMFSEEYGVVKKSSLYNIGKAAQVSVLDGIQNILPTGVNPDLQRSGSNLVNAYKKNELEKESGLGIFALSAMIVDRAEPSEALKATTVWSAGVEVKNYLLSSEQIAQFRKTGVISTEEDVRAERGAYMIQSDFKIDAQASREWYIVADINQDHSDVYGLLDELEDKSNLLEQLKLNIESGTKALAGLVAKADGLQLTADKMSVGRHYGNVLFNIMRGGIFDDGYQVDKTDFIDYASHINQSVFDANRAFFEGLAAHFLYRNLIVKAIDHGNSDVIRICREYLPLSFSRRHGDPSRPWNKFSIVIKQEDGSKIRRYEGNWRDIFQNWEALSYSFPEYILSMITKFVNASTLDGYNPYRITREGIDWELIEPDDPWSYIGYWGDHQIIYLQKLMEVAYSHYKEDFQKILDHPQFVYANVPYRIKSFEDIKSDPQDTIDFDHKVQEFTEQKVAELGSDGKLVFGGDGNLLKANLTEKLLVSLLAKMTNFVPEGGIWLNTQRPEWNDANNALVGNGISMVTLYYMRRFVQFLKEAFAESKVESFTINQPVKVLFEEIFTILEQHRELLSSSISDKDRGTIVNQLGIAGNDYRNKAYKGFDGRSAQVGKAELEKFFDTTLKYLDHTIASNKREDGLYHSYNLLSIDGEEASIEYMYEMLEGQVGILSSGSLAFEEAVSLLDALKASKIYRRDQYSYMLYPNRELPRFLEKNTLPEAFVSQSELISALLKAGNKQLVTQDVKGHVHFNGRFRNAKDLKQELNKLRKTSFGELVNDEEKDLLKVFEQMFNHKAFTGRSGTFYGYEGLGSIYWHMVSKLLLAVQESINSAPDKYKGTELMGRMVDHYYEIRAGIGMNKGAELYGAFPTDPYSHTPGNKGAQQPGMTGQVKEDILNRWAELGVKVKDTTIHFDPTFLNPEEFLTDNQSFEFFDLNGATKTIDMKPGQLGFTYCQVPVVYQKAAKDQVEVEMNDGHREIFDGRKLDAKISQEVFARNNGIKSISVSLNL